MASRSHRARAAIVRPVSRVRPFAKGGGSASSFRARAGFPAPPPHGCGRSSSTSRPRPDSSDVKARPESTPRQHIFALGGLFSTYSGSGD